MNDAQNTTRQFGLFTLVWPIFIESLLRILFGNVDTFMLSSYSDNAVAGVGASSQYVSVIILFFQVVSSGSAIIISQYLGAKNNKKASEVAIVSIAFNTVLGLLISFLLFLFAGKILGIMNFQKEIYDHAREYLTIIGTFSFITSISITASDILRSHGFVKYPMYVNMAANVLNIIGNSIFIYGLFGAPVLGVKGVAISTVSSQLIGLIVIMVILIRKIDIDLSIKNIVSLPLNTVKEVLAQVLKIGGPAAGESLSYNISQIVITAIVGTMGAYALTTKVYVFNLMLFIMLSSLSIGQGTQIIVSRLIGAGKMDDAYKTSLRSLRIAIIISLSVAVLFAIFGRFILDLFTDDLNILATGSLLLIIAVLIEPGRACNIILGSSLKGAGDAKYILILGLVFMWSIAVSMSYVLGVKLHLGLVGVWISFGIDEWIRGIFMFHRWKSRAWEKFSVTKKDVEASTLVQLLD